jgi:hypothetical protein
MGRNLDDEHSITEVDRSGMGCVLRVWGDEFNVDDLLSRVSIQPGNVQRKGTPRFGPQSKVAEETGFYVVTSEASEYNFPAQVHDTIAYLRAHGNELATIMSYPGVSGVALEFSVASRLGHNDIVAQHDFLPSELLLLAGSLGIGIYVTQYMLREFDVPEPS